MDLFGLTREEVCQALKNIGLSNRIIGIPIQWLTDLLEGTILRTSDSKVVRTSDGKIVRIGE